MQATSTAESTAIADAWEERLWASRAVSVALFLLPIIAAAAAIRATASLYHHGEGLGGLILWLIQILVVAIVVSHLATRMLARFAPLPALFRLELKWPGKAPSRLKVAFGAPGTGSLGRTLVALPEEEGAAALKALSMIADRRSQDRKAAVRSFRIAGYADLIASQLELDEEYRNQLRWAVLLHDIGLAIVPPEVLQKRGVFTTSEALLYQRHPNISTRILEPLTKFLGPSFKVAGQHHEHWNGRGYPNGLSRGNIAVPARICAVADAYDAMTWPRRGRALLSDNEACTELLKKAGTQFDPEIVGAMIAVDPTRRRAVVGWVPISWLPPFIASRAANAFVPALATIVSALTLPLLTAAMAMPTTTVPTLAFDDAPKLTRAVGENSQFGEIEVPASVTTTIRPQPAGTDPAETSTSVAPTTSQQSTSTAPATTETTTTTEAPTTTTTTRAPQTTTTRVATTAAQPAPTTTRAPVTTTPPPTTTAAPGRRVNIATNGSASQSSTGFGGQPGRAIDGNNSGQWSDRSITHTRADDALPWWEVELAAGTDIHSIRLWNRTDNCCDERLADFSVFVSNSPFDEDATIAELRADPAVWSFSFNGVAGVATDLNVNTTGRYVRVQKPAGSALSLAEVQIFELQ